VDQQALHTCSAQARGNCEQVVPGLAQCMATHAVRNQAALADRQQNFGPLWPTTSATERMLEAEAIARALEVSPNATPQSPVIARSMTLAAFAQLSHGSVLEFGNVDLGRIVWVVTVHAALWTDGSPFASPRRMSAYTIVFDAASWTGILTCIGCATLG